MAQAMRVGCGLHSELFDRCDLGADFDVVVGRSESRGRCETWVMFSAARSEQAAWTVHEMGPVVLLPYDEALGDRPALTDGQLAGGLHPVEDGLRIIDAQRGVAACKGGRNGQSQLA